jgi:hypothetical protein
MCIYTYGTESIARRDYPGAKMQTKFIKQYFLITLDGIVENYIISSTRKVIKTRRKEKVKKKKNSK